MKAVDLASEIDERVRAYIEQIGADKEGATPEDEQQFALYQFVKTPNMGAKGFMYTACNGDLLLYAALSIMRALRDFDDSVFRYALTTLMLDELPE